MIIHKKYDLTYERMNEVVRYFPKTGKFLYKITSVWHIPRGNSYRKISIDRHSYEAQILAWFYMTGGWPDGTVDHKNQDPMDNRWNNLRLATKQTNAINSKIRSDNVTGYRGIIWDKARNKWRVYISVMGKQLNLGRYDKLEHAIMARKEKEIELFGEFSPWSVHNESN